MDCHIKFVQAGKYKHCNDPATLTREKNTHIAILQATINFAFQFNNFALEVSNQFLVLANSFIIGGILKWVMLRR